MSASLRSRAAGGARRFSNRRITVTRRYASDHHGADHHAAPVNESLGPAFYIFAGCLPASFGLYYLSQASEDGQPSRFTSYIKSWGDLGKRWEERNTFHTAAIEQAAQDRHLFAYAEKSGRVDLRFPEIFQTGSPINVPAGHSVNLDHVTAHYAQQFQAEEEKKAEAAAERSRKGN